MCRVDLGSLGREPKNSAVELIAIPGEPRFGAVLPVHFVHRELRELERGHVVTISHGVSLRFIFDHLSISVAGLVSSPDQARSLDVSQPRKIKATTAGWYAGKTTNDERILNMQYMGGKERQAKHITAQILAHSEGCTDYLEPFVGGGSIFSRIAPMFPGNAHGSDAHEDLALMWSAAIDGWEPPAVVSREEYASLKKVRTFRVARIRRVRVFVWWQVVRGVRQQRTG